MSKLYTPGHFEAKYENFAYTIYEDGYDVAMVACYPKDREDGVVEFIVRACNCHEELLEGLVAARELAQTFLVAGDPDKHTRQRLDIIEKVCNQGLAKIEGARMIDRPELAVGTRVEIVASGTLASHFVGLTGTIVRLTQPRWMARVRIDGEQGESRTFWVEELRALVNETVV